MLAITQLVVCPRADLAVLTVGGSDGPEWLQGMLTQDVVSLTPGQSRYALALDIKGKALADMQATREGDRVVLVLPAGQRDALHDHLARRFVIEDVVLDRPDLAVVSVQGPGSSAAARTHGMTLQRSHTGGEGVELLVAADQAEAVITALVQSGAQRCSAEDLEPLRIAAAIPRYGADFDDKTIPLEAGLLDAIHWSKGCYLGQEVIARMAHRGHTNKELRRLSLRSATVPESGAAIFLSADDDKPVGRITSAASSPDGEGVVALALIRRKAFEAGTSVLVEVSGRKEAATVDGIRMRAHIELEPDNDPTVTRSAKQTGMLRG
jgi:folate-binding protein YgfZ